MLDLADAVANAPPVGFQFLFARTARADAAAEAGKFLAASGEARQQVIQLRELHLQLAFAGARVAGKNIENQLGAVNHARADAFLHIAELHGSEVVIHDHQRHVPHFGFDADFIELAAAHQRGGVQSVAHLHHAAGDFCSGAFGQLGELQQRIAARGRRVARIAAHGLLEADADQQHAFAIVQGLSGLHAARLRLVPCNVRRSLFIPWLIILRTRIGGESQRGAAVNFAAIADVRLRSADAGTFSVSPARNDPRRPKSSRKGTR